MVINQSVISHYFDEGVYKMDLDLEEIQPEVTSYNTSNNRVLIICEDSTLGYSIYKKALPSIFRDIQFGFVTCHGFGGIKQALDSFYTNKFDTCIVIYDNGAVKNVLRDINKNMYIIR